MTCMKDSRIAVHQCKVHLWKMSMSSVAIMVGSLRRLAKIAASASSNVSWDRIDAYRKLLRMGSFAASVAASFLQEYGHVFYIETCWDGWRMHSAYLMLSSECMFSMMQNMWVRYTGRM